MKLSGPGFIVGLMFLLLATGFCYAFYSTWRNDRLLRSWPTVRATVLSCEIVKTTREPVGSARTASTRRAIWEVQITYRYEVQGKEYTGNRLSNNPPGAVFWKPETQLPERLVEIRDRYVAGTITDIHYKPSRHGQSYLFFRPTGSLWVLLVVGLGFLVLGGFLFVIGLQK
jgi:hypothetical protein